jgi:hypothetical protein
MSQRTPWRWVKAGPPEQANWERHGLWKITLKGKAERLRVTRRANRKLRKLARGTA